MRKRMYLWIGICAAFCTVQAGMPAQAEGDWTEIMLVQDASTVSGGGASVKGNVVSITKGGNYRLTGSLTDGQIYVEAGKKDEITLALDGVSIENAAGDAIHIENAEKVTLVLTDGTENTVVSGTETVIDENAEPQSGTAEGAAIYARDDLAVEGEGSLTVSGYINNGLHTTNNLTITSGNIDVTAVNNGIKGKDSVTVSGGNISVLSGGDGIQSDDETGEGYGVVHILDGTIRVESYGDGIFAQTQLMIEDGAIDVTRSSEALEANQIGIRGGNIFLRASDDGMNAYGGTSAWGWGRDSQKTTGEMPNLLIEGGTITVDADGDGLDSNGNIYIEGGVIVVNGPVNSANGAIDSGTEIGGVCVVNGGTILALGSAGMAEGFDSESGQCSFLYNLSDGFEAGAKIAVTDADGQELFSCEAVKEGGSVVFSSPELEQGGTYTLSVDGREMEVTLDDVSTTVGAGGLGGFGGFRGKGMGGFRGENRAVNGGTPPEGMQPGDGGTLPEMPEGTQPGGGDTPPEMPEGMQPGAEGTPPDETTKAG